jgi:GNAT superfamily N-acetyltransferase
MLLRSFCLSDCARVPKLFAEALTEDCFEATMAAFSSQLAWDSELILVAEMNGEVAGVIIGTIEKDQGLYHRVVVAPAYRNLGIGKQLIQQLRKRFIHRKVKSISVKHDPFNMSLLSVWQKMNNALDDDSPGAFDFKIAARF